MHHDYWPEAITSAEKLTKKRTETSSVFRTKVVHSRITPGERAMLDRIAKECGTTLSAFVRDAALDVARAFIESNGEEPEA